MLRIADWVLRMARYGFPRSPAQIKEAVKMILDKSKVKVQQFAENRPGKTWFYAFLRRHTQIKMSLWKSWNSHELWPAQKKVFMRGFTNLRNFVKIKVLEALIKFKTAMSQVFPFKLLYL